MRSKRFRAAFLSLCFCLITVFPVKRSEAVIPIVGLAVAAVGPGGAVVSADMLAAGVGHLIGGVIMALLITPSTADAPVRVPLASDQATIDQVMPPPTAPATAEAVPGGYQYMYGQGQWYSTKCAISAALGYHQSNAQYSFTGCNEGLASSAGWEYCWVHIESGTPGCQSMTATQVAQSVSCPNGYTASAGTCVLTAPRAIPDNKADMQRTPSGFSPASGEADALPQYAVNSGGKVYASGRDSSGRPVMVEYAVSADGSKTYVTHYTQDEVGGQTVVNTQAVTVDAATGQVTSANASTAQGSLSGVGTGSVPTVNTGTAVSPTTPSEIVFPSDYARTGEAAAAANVVKSSVDGVKDKLTNSEAVSDPVVPDWVDPWGNSFNGLTGWQLPGHVSSCPAPSFDWNGASYAFTTHCQLWADHSSAFTVVMAVVWAVLALFLVLGA